MAERREILGAALAAGAWFLAGGARAEGQTKAGPAGKPPGSGKAPDAPPQSPLPPALQAVQEATARCTRDARVCLSRCTDHLAAGMKNMAECQHAVMNVLPVVEAMATLAGYRSADPRNLKSMAQTCVGFCTTCENACAPHARAHEECKACMEACRECIRACEVYIRS